MGKKKTDDLVHCLIKSEQKCSLMENSLKAILMNTLNRTFDNDPFYKTGVLSSIQVALGKEKYDYWVEYYS